MAEIIYTYDELRRLTAVAGPSGDIGIYTYDFVGNLLSIERRSSSVVSIIEFTPKSAPVGASVTIHGAGFSETPGENAVTFNGLPAAVISATATRVVTTVPSGTASGPISVTTPTGSATSSIGFTTTAVPEAPTIIEFSPSLGTVGTHVTITGTNFESTLANNKVTFNHTLAILRSANVTSMRPKFRLEQDRGALLSAHHLAGSSAVKISLFFQLLSAQRMWNLPAESRLERAKRLQSAHQIRLPL